MAKSRPTRFSSSSASTGATFVSPEEEDDEVDEAEDDAERGRDLHQQGKNDTKRWTDRTKKR